MSKELKLDWFYKNKHLDQWEKLIGKNAHAIAAKKFVDGELVSLGMHKALVSKDAVISTKVVD